MQTKKNLILIFCLPRFDLCNTIDNWLSLLAETNLLTKTFYNISSQYRTTFNSNNYNVAYDNYHVNIYILCQRETIALQKMKNTQNSHLRILHLCPSTLWSSLNKSCVQDKFKVIYSVQDKGFLLKFIHNSTDRATIFNIKILYTPFTLVRIFRGYMLFCKASVFCTP